jgi:hypothetical protein
MRREENDFENVEANGTNKPEKSVEDEPLDLLPEF